MTFPQNTDNFTVIKNRPKSLVFDNFESITKSRACRDATFQFDFQLCGPCRLGREVFNYRKMYAVVPGLCDLGRTKLIFLGYYIINDKSLKKSA